MSHEPMKDLEDRAQALAESLAAPIDGVDGIDGRDGRDGRDGIDGKTGDVGPRGPKGDKGDQGLKGDKGERGPKGDDGFDGDPGPMPAHRWDGTELQFERPDGSWGKRVDLQGPRGYTGASGGVLVQGGDFDLDSIGLADPDITPQEIIVKQNGVWLRLAWSDFVNLVGPPGERYADDYSVGYTVQ